VSHKRLSTNVCCEVVNPESDGVFGKGASREKNQKTPSQKGAAKKRRGRELKQVKRKNWTSVFFLVKLMYKRDEERPSTIKKEENWERENLPDEHAGSMSSRLEKGEEILLKSPPEHRKGGPGVRRRINAFSNYDKADQKRTARKRRIQRKGAKTVSKKQ